jgi:hypothetical protein
MSSALRISLFVMLVGCLTFQSATSAHAMDKDVRTVLIASGYGAVGGAVVGLVAWPLSERAESIWIGSLVGLTLGVAVGIFHIGHRDDPQNPLNSDGSPQSDLFWNSSSSLAAMTAPKPEVYLAYPVLSF